VDGGIDAATAPLVVRAGAKVLVAGSAIFGYREGVTAAMARLQGYVHPEDEREPADHPGDLCSVSVRTSTKRSLVPFEHSPLYVVPGAFAAAHRLTRACRGSPGSLAVAHPLTQWRDFGRATAPAR
jgi:hypothetical protein